MAARLGAAGVRWWRPDPDPLPAARGLPPGPPVASLPRGQGHLPPGHQVIDLAQVDLVDITGLALHGARADRVVVGAAAD